MLYVSFTGSTAVTVTLGNNTQNQVNPYYTWQLLDKDSNNEYILYMDDFSTAPYYYNSFTFSGGLTAGQYTYNIYEMGTASDFNLANAVGKVENGILNVIGTYSIIQSYTESNNTTNVYRNQNRV